MGTTPRNLDERLRSTPFLDGNTLLRTLTSPRRWLDDLAAVRLLSIPLCNRIPYPLEMFSLGILTSKANRLVHEHINLIRPLFRAHEPFIFSIWL